MCLSIKHLLMTEKVPGWFDLRMQFTYARREVSSNKFIYDKSSKCILSTFPILIPLLVLFYRKENVDNFYNFKFFYIKCLQ